MSEGTRPVEQIASIPNASRGWQGEARAKRRGTGRTSRGRQTRDQLLDAARVVFERDGFLHARVADICDEAGTSHGSFYTYFISKEEIFRKVVDSVELDLLAVGVGGGGAGATGAGATGAGAAGTTGADAIERIRAANEHYLRTYAANAGIMRVIHQVATIDVDVWRIRFQRQDAFAHSIERRIRQLQADGLADPDVEPAYAAQALGGMVAYFAELLFNSHDPVDFDADKAVDELTRIWLNALGIKHPAKPAS
ncbi:TetR/AcrR family transcriptional regulator [Pseudofrankia sp. BMG5.36]|uniref:TetR/AcrR family transcriptional regulator n=1 Tax=Pseudofrankia sp. BMG5.36 TaxID=1834512 RepID=UPI0008DA43DC|nr:TetR/AcrR family transcriptional regulator [Pseudofrankia sp. BMG5.36]OHV48806.1 TetR family transcriptional regulator [Pseudofrankia sp. BMG5.36]